VNWRGSLCASALCDLQSAELGVAARELEVNRLRQPRQSWAASGGLDRDEQLPGVRHGAARLTYRRVTPVYRF
jgi:hypothetical protein